MRGRSAQVKQEKQEKNNLIFIMKKILLWIFISPLILSWNSCQENKQEENLDKYLNLRKQIINSEQKKIGITKKEIIENLRKAISFEDLMNYVERIDYKSNLTSRKIGDDFFEFTENIGNLVSGSKTRIDIKYLVSNDSIRFGYIEEIKNENQILIEDSVYKIDHQFVDKFVSKHNEKFSTFKSSKDLINYLINPDRIRIASGNGGSSYGEKETKMYCGILERNFDYIDSLLRSIIPEDQAIGVIGYNKLNSLQLKNNKNHEKLVEKIISINSEVNVHYTCVYKTVTIEKYLGMMDWDILPNIGLNCNEKN